jgi:hypothetical protein
MLSLFKYSSHGVVYRAANSTTESENQNAISISDGELPVS